MNGKAKSHTYPEHAEELIKAYVPDAEKLALEFGDLYTLACERDEEAAAQLEASCADMLISVTWRLPGSMVWKTVHA